MREHIIGVRTDEPDCSYHNDKNGSPAWGSAGNLGRNHFYGPGVNNWDMLLQKTLSLSERVNMQFRAES